MLQPFDWNMMTRLVFSFFFVLLLYFSPNEPPGHFIKQKPLISEECILGVEMCIYDLRGKKMVWYMKNNELQHKWEHQNIPTILHFETLLF